MVRRSRRILELLFGASLIYTAMAACGGGGTQNGGSAGGHAHGGAGQGGSGHGGAAVGGSDGSGIMDALTDPVREADAEPSSGTRLKAEYIESVDGARQYVLITEAPPPYANVPVTQSVWFDSMRNEDCVFRLAADGKLRCLPGVIDSSGTPPTAAYGVRSIDPQCTGQAYVFMPAPPVNCQNYDPPDYGLVGIDSPTLLERTPGSTAARVQARRAHAEPEHAELPPHGQSARVQQHW